MPKFRYKAKQGPDRTVEGEVDADSQHEAVAAVDAMGYSPVWVRRHEVSGKGMAAFLDSFISRRNVTVFTRQLAGLTRSGVPILKALSTVANQTGHARFRRLIEDIAGEVRDGKMLSEGLGSYPRLFSSLYINMVRAGEMSGALDVVLDRLADAREAEEETRRKIQSAIAYPSLILTVGALTVFILLTFFLPRVLVLFKDYKDLPLPTMILVRTSSFFSDNWGWILALTVLALAVLRRISSIENGKSVMDAVKLRLPLLGQFIIKSEIVRMARTLSLLIESGISIDRAIGLSGNALENEVMKKEILDVRKNTVQQGATFSEGLRKASHFPVFVSNMCAVGEEGGRLDESLRQIAQFYEKEVEHQSRLATSLLEPLLILVVGGIVGFIVAAMLLPIFRLGSGL